MFITNSFQPISIRKGFLILLYVLFLCLLSDYSRTETGPIRDLIVKDNLSCAPIGIELEFDDGFKKLRQPSNFMGMCNVINILLPRRLCK